MAELGDWERVGSELLGDFRIFKLRQDQRISPRNGRTLNFYVLESVDWVNVIPITDEGDVIMIRQFRHGTEEFSLEVPGGMVDPGEEPLEAAQRELLEETGYTCDELIPLGSVAPNPAIMNNRCHTFVALGARPAVEQKLGAGEDIGIEIIPHVDIARAITDGLINHALVIVAFYFYELHHRFKGQ